MTALSALTKFGMLLRYSGGRWQVAGWNERGPFVTDDEIRELVQAGQAEYTRRRSDGLSVEVRAIAQKD